MAGLYSVAKVGFFLLLTGFQLAFFGIPAIQSYLDGQVTVVETTDRASPILAPAITLCPVANYTRGWKNTTQSNWFGNYEEMCPDAEAHQEFVSCVEENTFGLGELIPYVPPYGLGATYGVYTALWCSSVLMGGS